MVSPVARSLACWNVLPHNTIVHLNETKSFAASLAVSSKPVCHVSTTQDLPLLTTEHAPPTDHLAGVQSSVTSCI